MLIIIRYKCTNIIARLYKFQKPLLTMQQEIQTALANSLIGDNQLLQKSNQKLSELSKIEGYCTSLMQIINDYSLGIPIKQAALIQLKNNIKTKWKPKNEKIELSANEKNAIRNALIKAIILCAKNYMLIKIYREVLTTVIGYQYETWIPLNDLISLLNSGTNLSPVFHCIIAICTNFQFSIVEKEKVIFSLFLKQILPAIIQVVAKNLHDPEVVYLSLKVLWKVVHYQITSETKLLLNDWMELIYLTISSENPEFQKKIDDYQAKNTPEFYYFHSKKWATRILMRFVQKHAKAYQFGKITPENIEYSKFWYQNYGLKLCQKIVEHLSKPIDTTKKIRYFQLKVLQGIVNDKPELVGQDSKHFQYDILLKYMVITPEEEKLANQDVVQYLRVDDESTMTYSNIKRVATDVWNCFMQLQSKFDREKNLYHPGPLFEENLNFMFEKISSQNLLEKELGMYLFCENRITIGRVATVKEKMPEIISKYVVPQLGSTAVMIRAKALDMLFEFGRQIKDEAIMAQCLQAVYACLVEPSSPPLVKIRAAIALNSLVCHPESKKYLKDHLQNILQVYLKLIELYDLEQVVTSLEYFISDFSDSIGPYAIQLFIYLATLFAKMFQKDIDLSQNDDYGSQVQLAASGCIKTMTQILQAPLQPQIRMQIETCVLDVCAFLFTNQSYDYFEDMMFLLRVHLEKVQKISPACWFYYQTLIYFIVGIPTQQWGQIQNSPLPQMQKKILACVKTGNNFEFLQFVVPILRNYLGKGYNMIMSQKPEFKTNVVHLIMYLVVQVYKKGVNAEVEGEIHLDCSSIMLVYLLQTFPPELTQLTMMGIWNVCKYNISKGKSIYIKQITSQLMGVLLWKHPLAFLQAIYKENAFSTLAKYIVSISKSFEEFQQRKRVILGICTFLTIVERQYDVLSPYAPSFFKTLIKMVKKNCVVRILTNTKDQNLKKEMLHIDDDQDEGLQEYNEDDEDDMWDEDYNEKNVSILRKTNELTFFQETVAKLRTENQRVFELITKSVEPQKLQKLQSLLANAADLPER